MKYHVNIETDEKTIPEYASVTDSAIYGFFGENRFLSNFYPCRIGVFWMGTLFPSTEHAYQAAKFPKKYHKEFVDVTAGQSKKLARAMTKEDPSLYDDDRWNKVKDTVMAQIVFQKFTNNQDLKQLLLNTGEKYLEETNSWGDVYWGVCNGKGKNKLGNCLIWTRNYINAVKL